MMALLDCNNFYASCERIFRPDLIGQPIVVLSNNDGCIIARSAEAKTLGIPMGIAWHLLEKKHLSKLHVFSANFPLYGDLSSRVMNILQLYCPDVEIYSIDEAFIDLEKMHIDDYHTFGMNIVHTIKKSLGLPTCIGFGKTKVLAKVANHIAKKFPDKTSNLYIIDTEEKRVKALRWLPIDEIWGIGRQNSKKLRTLGIQNAYEFSRVPERQIRNIMGIVGVRIQMELNGVKVLKLEDIKSKKSIAVTRSFDRMIIDHLELEERITTFTMVAAEKLRLQKRACDTLMIFIHTNYFRDDLPRYSQNIIIKNSFMTNSSFPLVKSALQGLKKIFKDGYHYKKAGVVLLNLCDAQFQQQSLFDTSFPKQDILMKAMDSINRQFGAHTIHLGIQDKTKIWKMRQQHLSPRYTTKLSDILQVKGS